MNPIFEEMIDVANKKVVTIVNQVMLKRGLAHEYGYKNITRVVDAENKIEYYYAGYPKEKVFIFSMQLKDFSENHERLVFPNIVISFDAPVD